ncbi:MAG: polyphosphate kinase 1 [Halobacteria archaeon]
MSDSDTDIALDDTKYYLNRELSELEFQKRVLDEALDDENPLLERVKFLAIFTTNMDEFFRKRVGGLKQQIHADVTETTPDGMTPGEQWDVTLEESRSMFQEHEECYRQQVKPLLADAGIHILDYGDLDRSEEEDLREYMRESILPTLTPLTFDSAHPFPFISNLSLSIGALTKREDEDESKFSRIKIPENRPRIIQVDDPGEVPGEGDSAQRYVLLEEIIRNNLDLVFPNVDVLGHGMFRVTRNAEVGSNEDVAEDLIDMIEDVLRQRRFAAVVRLEVTEDVPEKAVEVLKEQLELEEKEIYRLQGPLDMRDLMDLHGIDRPELKRRKWCPQPHPRFQGMGEGDIFDEIRKKDVLLHHPYHSFDDTVKRFFEEAANDPDVLAIKLAIYRTAPDSEIIESIIEAARNGKQVAVMVEIKARFDEEKNLQWVERLESEGIHVAYGTPGYKTHTKTAMVVREEEEEDATRIYSHVATGNYHSETAKQYSDLGLLTVDREIGHDLTKVFDYFTGHSYHTEYDKLLVAPGNMREKFKELIRNEAHPDGVIQVKINRLEDPELVRELYEASAAGCDIDLIVRDICRLRPGLEGVSENVEVRSIVGRFLEHDRIYYFGGDDPGFYLGSADWMVRNLDKRVEAVTPVEDPEAQEELRTILEVMMEDNRNAWRMNSDGGYTRIEPGEDEESADGHIDLMEKAERERI